LVPARRYSEMAKRSIIREVKKLLLRRAKAQVRAVDYDQRALEREAKAVGPQSTIDVYASAARFQRKMQARNAARVDAADAGLKAVLATTTPEELTRLLRHWDPEVRLAAMGNLDFSLPLGLP
jgi:hypothetical protein